ncbi:hypothetical protein [Paucihalobacter sp.]|uniref:hypothetical protein n=1 Tax=Paucihalobacter sp. TaxID=2850405 RepID=UPI003D160A93
MKLVETNFKKLQISLLLLLISLSNLSAQTYEKLNFLEGYHVKTYFSNDAKKQAENMAIRCDSVISFYKSHLNFEPTITLLVLSPNDWSNYTNFPVYGMPHYKDDQTLIVASDDNDFWKSFIPPLDQLPPQLAQQISEHYKDENNILTMRSFFDLLAVHELGHAFHIQGELTMQRKWMGELFANILLHTYIAEKEPQLLPNLTIFPKMVVSSTNKADLKFTTLNELEINYELIGQQYPNNYGWYQTRWHMAAATIYDVGGVKALQNLWQTLKIQKKSLDDAAFAKLLIEKAHQSIADVQLKWDE